MTPVQIAEVKKRTAAFGPKKNPPKDPEGNQNRPDGPARAASENAHYAACARSGDGFGHVHGIPHPDHDPSTMPSLLRLAPSRGRSSETHLRHTL